MGEATPRGSLDATAAGGAGSGSSSGAGQASWLARLRATQKTGGSPTAGRSSIEAAPSSGTEGKAEAERPGFVQTTKTDAAPAKPSVFAGFLASAKDKISAGAAPKVTSAADDDDEDDYGQAETSYVSASGTGERTPHTGTTSTSSSTVPNSAGNLLDFDEAVDGGGKAKGQQGGAETAPSGLSRWLGWGRKKEAPPPHVLAGVSEEAYADRMEAGESALTKADLEWLDKTAPAQHSPMAASRPRQGHATTSPLDFGPDRIEVQPPSARSVRVQHQPQQPEFGASPVSPSSPLDNWLAAGQRQQRPVGGSLQTPAQYAVQGIRQPPPQLMQAPQPGGARPSTGPTAGRPFVPMTPGRGPGGTGSAPVTSTPSADAFGDFQTQNNSTTWTPPLPSSVQQKRASYMQGPRVPTSTGNTPGSTAFSDFGTPATGRGHAFTPTTAGSGGAGRSVSGGGRPASQVFPAPVQESRYEYDEFESPVAAPVRRATSMRATRSDGFAPGRSTTIDEDFGRDYRYDADDDEEDGGVLGGGEPGYRDDPDDFMQAPPPITKRAADQASLPPREPAARQVAPTANGGAAPAKKVAALGDLLGDFGLEDKPQPAPPQQQQHSDEMFSDFLGDTNAPRTTGSSNLSRSSSMAASSATSRTTRLGGPQLAAAPGQTRAGGLLPPPPPGSGNKNAAAPQLGAPFAQQVRGSSSTSSAAAPAASAKKGPSAGKGMTQDDLSFFETL